MKEKGLEAHHRVVLHATVAGVLYLAPKISRNEVLKTHIDGVIAKRKETAPKAIVGHSSRRVSVCVWGGGSLLKGEQCVIQGGRGIFPLAPIPPPPKICM